MLAVKVTGAITPKPNIRTDFFRYETGIIPARRLFFHDSNRWVYAPRSTSCTKYTKMPHPHLIICRTKICSSDIPMRRRMDTRSVATVKRRLRFTRVYLVNVCWVYCHTRQIIIIRLFRYSIGFFKNGAHRKNTTHVNCLPFFTILCCGLLV